MGAKGLMLLGSDDIARRRIFLPGKAGFSISVAPTADAVSLSTSVAAVSVLEPVLPHAVAKIDVTINIIARSVDTFDVFFMLHSPVSQFQTQGAR
jgi:hypothetical protein